MSLGPPHYCALLLKGTVSTHLEYRPTVAFVMRTLTPFGAFAVVVVGGGGRSGRGATATIRERKGRSGSPAGRLVAVSDCVYHGPRRHG